MIERPANRPAEHCPLPSLATDRPSHLSQAGGSDGPGEGIQRYAERSQNPVFTGSGDTAAALLRTEGRLLL